MARSKVTKHQAFSSSAKATSISGNVNGYYDMPVSFSFRRYDNGTEWSASIDNKPIIDDVFYMLRGKEGQTWKEVEQTYGGRTHGTNNHRISINDLSKEAQKRAIEIMLNENELYSLRLQGTVRLWGVIEQLNGCFYIIWYDPNHQVYPLSN
jgi:hypothetical protein